MASHRMIFLFLSYHLIPGYVKSCLVPGKFAILTHTGIKSTSYALEYGCVECS